MSLKKKTVNDGLNGMKMSQMSSLEQLDGQKSLRRCVVHINNGSFHVLGQQIILSNLINPKDQLFPFGSKCQHNYKKTQFCEFCQTYIIQAGILPAIFFLIYLPLFNIFNIIAAVGTPKCVQYYLRSFYANHFSCNMFNILQCHHLGEQGTGYTQWFQG